MSKNSSLFPARVLLSPRYYLLWAIWCIPPSIVSWFAVPHAFEYVWNQTVSEAVVASMECAAIFAVWGAVTLLGLRLAERLKWV